MIVPCIKGGLIVDSAKCAPLEDNNLIMHITDKLSFEFYDIYDCKTGNQLSISNLMIIDFKVKQEDYEKRMAFYKKHKKVLISRAITDSEYSVFFNSIEMEALDSILSKNRFTAKVSIVYKDEEVTLKELKQKSKKDFKNAVIIIEELNMVEMIDVKDYEEIVNKVQFPHKPKLIDVGLGFLIGTGVGVGASFLIKKIFSKRKG